MLYVGLTEDHKESATMFANVVGAQVISQALTANSSMKSAAASKSGWFGKEFHFHFSPALKQFRHFLVKYFYFLFFACGTEQGSSLSDAEPDNDDHQVSSSELFALSTSDIW